LKALYIRAYYKGGRRVGSFARHLSAPLAGRRSSPATSDALGRPADTGEAPDGENLAAQARKYGARGGGDGGGGGDGRGRQTNRRRLLGASAAQRLDQRRPMLPPGQRRAYGFWVLGGLGFAEGLMAPRAWSSGFGG